ncbi:MAG: hypothetical protein GY847_37200 [Proteobacteria bacterium]|nr:hypothetical protein [Pseudomonadota bacterium]
MKRKFKRLGLLVFISVAAVATYSQAGEGWKLSKDSKGVKVFTKPKKGTDYLEMKAIGKTTYPFEIGVELLKDYDHYHEWYGMCKELKVIKKRSENDYDMYFILDVPFPGTDRDVVINVKTGWDFKKKTAWVKIKRIDSDYKKDSGLVRMTDLYGGFQVKKTAPDTVQVTYKIYADLAGSLPAWIVNLAAKKHPFDTVRGVSEQTKKQKYWKMASKVHNKQFVRKDK